MQAIVECDLAVEALAEKIGVVAEEGSATLRRSVAVLLLRTGWGGLWTNVARRVWKRLQLATPEQKLTTLAPEQKKMLFAAVLAHRLNAVQVKGS